MIPQWLADQTSGLLIEGPIWRQRARELRKLPRWAHEPDEDVREYFQLVQNAGSMAPDLPEDLAERVVDHFKRDLVAFMWFGTSIRDRDTRRRVLPEWQPGQVALMWRVQLTIDAGLMVRLDLLKQRQGGFSTLFANISYWVIAFRKNISGIQAAQDKDTTRQLHSYVKEVFEMQPGWMRPAHRFSSRLELDLTEPKEEKRLEGERGNESSIQAQTAGKDFLGTGLPLQVMHASEIGKWHKVCDVEPTYTSVINAIQDVPGTFIFRESTAHGADTYWHREWKTSMLIGRPGWNDHTPVFLPWYLDDRNRRPAPPAVKLCDSDSDEYGNELALKEEFDLDDEQLMWRRANIRKQPAGVRAKSELFKQEHPSTQAEAWLFAGGRYVPVDVLTRMRRDAYLRAPFIFQGTIEHRRELGRRPTVKRWMRKQALGPFTVFEKPDPSFEYLISADVAEGISDGDFSCAKVWKRWPDRIQQVAEWWGHTSTDNFANLLWRMGWWYSSRARGRDPMPALLAWERTGPGGGIHGWLTQGNLADPTDAYPASRMFRAHRMGRTKKKREQVFGVATTQQGKRPMLDMWLEWAISGQIDQIAPDVEEAASLELDDRGRVNTGGRDRFMASVIGVYAHRMAPYVVIPSEEKLRKQPKWGSIAWVDSLEEEGRERRRALAGSAEVLYTGPVT